MRPVYWFEEVKEDIVKFIGSSAWRIGQLSNLEIPSAPGFILSSNFTESFEEESKIPKLKSQLLKHLINLEKSTGKKLDSGSKPLILSVYPSSFDGCVDGLEPILNIGINDETVEGLSEYYHRPKFAYMTYIRFVSDYLQQVFRIDFEIINSQVQSFMQIKRVEELVALEIIDLKELVKILKNISLQYRNIAFPDNPLDQLEKIITEKISDWNQTYLSDYRRSIEFDVNQGLSLIVREQKFSNLGEDSVDVKVFTRNPQTGNRELIINGYHNWQRYTKLPFRKQYTKFALIDGNTKNKIQEYVTVLETYFNDALELNFIIEDKRVILNQVKPLKKAPICELITPLDLKDDYKKNLSLTAAHIDLANTTNILSPKIEISPSTRSICTIKSFAHKSVAGHMTTDPNMDLDSKILVLEKDPNNYYSQLNNCVGVLSLNPERSFLTILEAKRRNIPCYASNQLLIEEGVLKTDTGISIRNGAGITLCHYTSQMYAGLLEKVPANITDQHTEFHQIINQDLVDVFGLVANSKSELSFLHGLTAGEIFIELEKVLEDKSIEALRSELQFLMSQYANISTVFGINYQQCKTDPETVFNQVEAVLKAVLTSNRVDTVELVINGCDNQLEYKILLDWIERKLNRECLDTFKNLKKRMTVHNLDLLLTLDKRDPRFYGIMINLDQILASVFSKNIHEKDSLTSNVFSGMQVSNIRAEHPMNDWLYEILLKSSKSVNSKVRFESLLNDQWAMNLKKLQARSYLIDKDNFTANKILFFLADKK